MRRARNRVPRNDVPARSTVSYLLQRDSTSLLAKVNPSHWQFDPFSLIETILTWLGLEESDFYNLESKKIFLIDKIKPLFPRNPSSQYSFTNHLYNSGKCWETLIWRLAELRRHS